MVKFDSLNLGPALLRAIADKGYEIATPIQADAIPPILEGRDLIGCAQTGTGKTAAFALPTIHRILVALQKERDEAAKANGQPTDQPEAAEAPAEPQDSRRQGNRADRRAGRHQTSRRPQARRKTRALVLAPTRELVSQIAASFAVYGKHTALRHAVIYGGVGQGPQVKALQHGSDVIIATPGRLLDLMNQGHVDLSKIESLILDEADQMLDMGFIPDLKRIISKVPKQRQTLMFSATMPQAIRELAHEWLEFPVSVQTAPVATPAEKVDQTVYFVSKDGKIRLLEQWLQNTANSRTIVFSRTKHGADKIVKYLCKSKINAAAIHGNKSQNFRERTLQQFKSNRPPVLVATDIAARGLDIKEVSHVINYDIPETPETYVHRIGRTARAGATGSAISFCSAEEIRYFRGIEKLTRRRIEVGVGHEDLTFTAPPAPVDEPRPQRGGQRGRRGGPGGPGGGGNRRSRFSKSNGGGYGNNNGGGSNGAPAAGHATGNGAGGARPAGGRRFNGANGASRPKPPRPPKRRTDGRAADSEPLTLDGPAPANNKPPATGSGRRPKRRKKVTSKL
ncbi:DEAD/DEAH box helicase [Lacipirellula parvula]